MTYLTSTGEYKKVHTPMHRITDFIPAVGIPFRIPDTFQFSIARQLDIEDPAPYLKRALYKGQAIIVEVNDEVVQVETTRATFKVSKEGHYILSIQPPGVHRKKGGKRI